MGKGLKRQAITADASGQPPPPTRFVLVFRDRAGLAKTGRREARSRDSARFAAWAPTLSVWPATTMAHDVFA